MISMTIKNKLKIKKIQIFLIDLFRVKLIQAVQYNTSTKI